MYYVIIKEKIMLINHWNELEKDTVNKTVQSQVGIKPRISVLLGHWAWLFYVFFVDLNFGINNTLT